MGDANEEAGVKPDCAAAVDAAPIARLNRRSRITVRWPRVVIRATKRFVRRCPASEAIRCQVDRGC